MITVDEKTYAARVRKADSQILRVAYVWASKGPNLNLVATKIILDELIRRVPGPKGKLP